VQGGIVPAATGIALAEQLSGGDGLSVVFIGDGTLGEGAVYEALNIASLWSVPLLVVLEDNAWAQSTPQSLNLAGAAAERFRAFGLPTTELDTTDVMEISAAARVAVAECRERQGPAALVIHTYRLCHHSKNDDNRPVEEVTSRWQLDPLVVHGRRLPPDDIVRVDAEVETALSEVVDLARTL
jgi:TPP-dependent pyruvate/acetoin dehydrogenase alpha subunit